jgi:Pentapeptide repeats (8 copies)
MLFEIKHRFSSSILFSLECGSLKLCVEAAVSARANLTRANLADANLTGANLTCANLTCANLTRANLADANLTGANLTCANLADANLAGANLAGANLAGANLADANLTDAYLTDAYLTRANLAGANLAGAKNISPTANITGEPWSEYLEKVVPALLTAGGKSLETVCAAWTCHDWNNCPMAVAFDIHDPKDAPILLRPRVTQFVQLFDAKMLPNPLAAKEAVASK